MSDFIDNEFYFITFENFMGQILSINIHLRFGEKIHEYMLRVYGITEDKILCIYKRIYAK